MLKKLSFVAVALGALLIFLFWQNQESETPQSSVAAPLSGDRGSLDSAAGIPQADKGASAASAAKLEIAPLAVSDSANFRALVHQALVNPTAGNLRAALKASTSCTTATSLVSSDKRDRLEKLPQSLQALWRERENSCLRSGGVDLQQMRALSAAAKRVMPDYHELLAKPLTGSLDEAARIGKYSEPDLVLQWGMVATSAQRTVLIGNELELQKIPPDVLSAAWHAEVCRISKCDDIEYRVQACINFNICDNRPLDELIETIELKDRKLAAGAWPDAQNGTRKRLKALFPALAN